MSFFKNNEFSVSGYHPTGDVASDLESNNGYRQARGQNAAFEYGRQYDQEEHEKALQQEEQQRRQYDSETQRESVHQAGQKNSILSGLLGGTRTISGG